MCALALAHAHACVWQRQFVDISCKFSLCSVCVPRIDVRWSGMMQAPSQAEPSHWPASCLCLSLTIDDVGYLFICLFIYFAEISFNPLLVFELWLFFSLSCNMFYIFEVTCLGAFYLNFWFYWHGFVHNIHSLYFNVCKLFSETIFLVFDLRI